MKNKNSKIIAVVGTLLCFCVLLYLLFYVLTKDNVSYKYKKYYYDDSYYIPNKIEQEYIVLLGEAGYSCELDYPFEEGGPEEFDELSEDATIDCRMKDNKNINISSDNKTKYDIKVKIKGQLYDVNNAITLSKVNNIYQISTFMSVEYSTSDEYGYDDIVLSYSSSFRYLGKNGGQYLRENHRLYISHSPCELDGSFLENDKVVEDVLLNETHLEERDFSRFPDYENGRIDSVEESMKICDETIDTYGKRLYEDIVSPLKESRLDLMPKLLDIIDKKIMS